jgi:hypothetical protein
MSGTRNQGDRFIFQLCMGKLTISLPWETKITQNWLWFISRKMISTIFLINRLMTEKSVDRMPFGRTPKNSFGEKIFRPNELLF